MAISSLEFVVCLLVASAIMPLLDHVRLRQSIYAVCNLAFLASYVPNVASWAALSAFVFSGFAAGCLLRRWPRKGLLGTYLAFVVAAFIVLKKYGVLSIFGSGFLTHPIAIIGLSYMLFRQIHFVVDSMEGQIDDIRLWDYINYQIDFAALVAGPIQRYQDFSEDWHSLALPSTRHDILSSYFRLFAGIIKVAGLAAASLFVFDKVYGRMASAYTAGIPLPLPRAAGLFAVLFYTYPLYVYLNFSGYCDIAISAARLLGNQLPENFDQPYLSRNMLDFWTRWHRTLGFWIRDYLFTPIYKTLVERTSLPTNVSGVFSYFVAFLLAGIWHGTTSNFAVFGAMHGMGASASKLWEALLARRYGRSFIKNYVRNPVIRFAAIALTLNYFCLSMVFFSAPLGRSTLPFRVLFASIDASVRPISTLGRVADCTVVDNTTSF